MPKTKSLDNKEMKLKDFIKLTWEAVRRNQDYREDYEKFKESNPGGIRRSKFDGNLRRYVWDDEEVPDPERCNLSYMMQKWGFACDPDKTHPHPAGTYWLGCGISKEALEQRRKRGPLLNDPLILERTELRKLPGVLEVKAWPELKQTEESIQKQQEALKLTVEGWQPQNQQEQQEFMDATKGQWEIEDPPFLTISINLKAPSYLVLDAIEFLIKICKAELEIKGKIIEWQHMEKSLEIYDLYQDGCSEEDIADKVDLTHYKQDEANRDGLDNYLKEWGIPQVKRCLEDIKAMIKKGSII